MSLSLVLFHPRSGSSLLVQTLRLLGKPVLGRFESDCGQALNPRGFWDVPEIRDRGLTAELRERYQEPLTDAVVKVMLSATFDGGAEQWAWFAATRPTIFITYRHPLEQALSSAAAFRQDRGGSREHFIAVTHALRAWTFGIGRVVRLVRASYPELIPRIRFVGYHEHLEDPLAFVETVARHAGLAPGEADFRRAVENIDESLYRFRADEAPTECLRWYRAMPACRYYAALRETPTALWELEWPAEPAVVLPP